MVIEGVYSIRKELINMTLQFGLIDCPRETRLLRGIDRDGEEARDVRENNWMILEDFYVKRHMPHKKADFIISGIE